MFLFFYYLISFSITVFFAIVFREHIRITSLSVIPLICMALSVFMSLFNRNQQKESLNYNLNTIELSDHEYAQIAFFSSLPHSLGIPLHLPFILFFTSPIKFLSIVIFLICFILGPLIFRAKHKNQLYDRLTREETEKREQMQKEELGKWK